MSNYRRLISYIYAYEGEVKGRNIGFAKLEARNGQCKISVNVKKVYVGSSDLGVYLLSVGREIFLGNIFIRNGTGEYRISVMEDDVAGSGSGMDDCYGLTIHENQDKWRNYTTIWEDAVAHAAELELAEATAEKQRRQQELKAASSRESSVDKISQSLSQGILLQQLLSRKELQKETAQTVEIKKNSQVMADDSQENLEINDTDETGSETQNPDERPAAQLEVQPVELDQEEELQPELEAQEEPLRPGEPAGEAPVQEEPLQSEEPAIQEPNLPEGTAWEGQPQGEAPVDEEPNEPEEAAWEGQPQGEAPVDEEPNEPEETVWEDQLQGEAPVSEAPAQPEGSVREGPFFTESPPKERQPEPPVWNKRLQPEPLPEEAMLSDSNTEDSRYPIPELPVGQVSYQPGSDARGQQFNQRNQRWMRRRMMNPPAGAPPRPIPVHGNAPQERPLQDARMQRPPQQGIFTGSIFHQAAQDGIKSSSPIIQPYEQPVINDDSGQQSGSGAEEERETEKQPEIINKQEDIILGDQQELERLEQEEQEEQDADQIWDYFRKRYPKIQAFENEGGEILTIKPQDIGLLPREIWVYGNNSFLLHGYYNYRYLILAKVKGAQGTYRYLLGVPGHYYSNDKYMASMFGFPHFVLSKSQPAPEGRFGYWYTDIRLGN